MRRHICEWRRWFAWHPIKINGKEVVWLETVERKRVWGGDFDSYVYRLIREDEA